MLDDVYMLHDYNPFPILSSQSVTAAKYRYATVAESTESTASDGLTFDFSFTISYFYPSHFTTDEYEIADDYKR